VKAARITFRTSFFTTFCTSPKAKVSCQQGLGSEPQEKSSRGKITKSGGSDPVFWAPNRPKPFGVAPALPRFVALVIFPRLGPDSEFTTKGQEQCH